MTSTTIYELDNTYDPDEISLGNPGKLHGKSGYYTKIFIDKELFYFKIKNCTTKQGIHQTEKKIYTDIMFSLLNNDNEYIEWFHDLEEKIKELLLEKSSNWFISEMEKDDIDEYFNPLLRQYKINNNLLRVQLNNKKNAKDCIIFDENEDIKSYDDVYNRNMDCIIHIKGILFTSTSFQIDIELKQVLLLDDVNMFDTCLLSNSTTKKDTNSNKLNINISKLNNIEKNNDDSVDLEEYNGIKINETKIQNM